MPSTQAWNRILLLLSGVGAIAALATLFFPLPFPLCAAIALLCYLAGAGIALFLIPKHYQKDGKRKLPAAVRSINAAFGANAVLALFILPYARLVQQRLTYAVVLVTLSYVGVWIALAVLVFQGRNKHS